MQQVTKIRFSCDEDLLRYEPQLEDIFPRKDVDGGPLRDWNVYRGIAVQQITRKLRGRHGTADAFELGRIGLRSRDGLRDVETFYTLHYIYVAADTMGDATGYLSRKAAHYWKRAEEVLELEAQELDYDLDGDGQVNASEQRQPMPIRFIRG